MKTLLWTDFLLGFLTGIVGISFPGLLENFLQIPDNVIVFIAVITLLYSLLALLLVQQKSPAEKLVRILIIANWLWSIASVILLYLYFSNASTFGKLFLILQILVVGGLAYLEGLALKKART